MSKKKDMKLKCPKCKTVLPYGGYPSNPNVSTVACLTCGYVGAGYAFHRICDGCGKDFDIDDVKIEEKEDGYSVLCKKCERKAK